MNKYMIQSFVMVIMIVDDDVSLFSSRLLLLSYGILVAFVSLVSDVCE